MRKFSHIKELFDAIKRDEKIKALIKTVEEKLKDSFSLGLPKFKFTISKINDVETTHYYFYLVIYDKNETPSEWLRTSKRLIPEVENIFKRLDDQGLEPLLMPSDWEDENGYSGIMLAFGEINFEDSEIVKSIKTINKFDL
jgi:hypothetical protein